MYQITCAADLESLHVLRRFIDTSCRPAVDERTLYDLKLAVDEACTNIITHGYAGMDPGSIMLRLELDSRKITLTITDFGHPFEPYEPDKPDVNAAMDETELSGFGLFFIYESMDEIDYQETEDGNSLILTKRLPAVDDRTI